MFITKKVIIFSLHYKSDGAILKFDFLPDIFPGKASVLVRYRDFTRLS